MWEGKILSTFKEVLPFLLNIHPGSKVNFSLTEKKNRRESFVLEFRPHGNHRTAQGLYRQCFLSNACILSSQMAHFITTLVTL